MDQKIALLEQKIKEQDKIINQLVNTVNEFSNQKYLTKFTKVYGEYINYQTLSSKYGTGYCDILDEVCIKFYAENIGYLHLKLKNFENEINTELSYKLKPDASIHYLNNKKYVDILENLRIKKKGIITFETLTNIITDFQPNT